MFIESAGLPWHEPPGHVRGYSQYVVTPSDGRSERFDFRLSRYPVGGRVDPHVHEVAEQLYFFIEGAGTVLCGDETYQVGPGHTVLVAPGVVHAVENTGAVDLLFTVTTSPPDDIER
ncbi:hypothetical protein GCM10009775_24090 [Microbacterium aoyamense]|uniref:Cupin type-2 domain-containing protein n=1 Tax=Microbacterium aoyamense TaxID=344166 RepID=A0ABP5B4T2_9MICO|nr:cupin domain-containing protein [Microbacterium aoyamense]